MTPFEFFAGMQAEEDAHAALHSKIAALGEEDIDKVSLFVDWISK